MKHSLVVALYGDPEAYPPTLHALTQLSDVFTEVHVLHRPLDIARWPLPENVQFHPSGSFMKAVAQHEVPVWRRYALFARYVRDLVKLLRGAPDAVLLYDPLALLAFSLARHAMRRSAVVWYHNHDVVVVEHAKPMSLAWLAGKAEHRTFSSLDMFSLPADERRSCFPMHAFSGAYFFLPNYPALSAYRAWGHESRDNRTLRVLFQGSVGAGHGLENLIALLPLELEGRRVELVLKGRIEPEYRANLEGLVAARGIADRVHFVGYTSYAELLALTASCHVGIAIHTQGDIMNRTLGTASNKIYEYAASGLPVLYYDNEHFRSHLGEYRWAFATDASPESLRLVLSEVAAKLAALSASARRDFEASLHFERYFAAPVAFLRSRLGTAR